jgi:hypothetical protein
MGYGGSRYRVWIIVWRGGREEIAASSILIAGIVSEEVLQQLRCCLAYSNEVRKVSPVRRESSARYRSTLQRRSDAPATCPTLLGVPVYTYLVLKTLTRRGTQGLMGG